MARITTYLGDRDNVGAEIIADRFAAIIFALKRAGIPGSARICDVSSDSEENNAWGVYTVRWWRYFRALRVIAGVICEWQPDVDEIKF